jgi:hypothetical protein
MQRSYTPVGHLTTCTVVADVRIEPVLLGFIINPVRMLSAGDTFLQDRTQVRQAPHLGEIVLQEFQRCSTIVVPQRNNIFFSSALH